MQDINWEKMLGAKQDAKANTGTRVVGQLRQVVN
jgi:hypothetical protein